jgi:hypothetical protein
MILKVHLDGAASHDVGDEIWQESFVDAIHTEAETIASYVGSDLLQSSDQAQRNALRDRIVGEMAAALMSVGDRYRAPDGVLYSLIEESALEPLCGGGKLRAMGNCTSAPIVEEVLRFEDLPLGSAGTRRAVVRWSDGTEDAPMTWYSDEILVCEGDLAGKTRAEIRSLHFCRDRDWLQS